MIANLHTAVWTAASVKTGLPRAYEEQIIAFVRQAEVGVPINEIRRKHGFTDASFYKCRSKFVGMAPAKPYERRPQSCIPESASQAVLEEKRKARAGRSLD